MGCVNPALGARSVSYRSTAAVPYDAHSKGADVGVPTGPVRGIDVLDVT